MRAEGGLKHVITAIENMEPHHKLHIELYGEDNDLRLTGKHETASID